MKPTAISTKEDKLVSVEIYDPNLETLKAEYLSDVFDLKSKGLSMKDATWAAKAGLYLKDKKAFNKIIEIIEGGAR